MNHFSELPPMLIFQVRYNVLIRPYCKLESLVIKLNRRQNAVKCIRTRHYYLYQNLLRSQHFDDMYQTVTWIHEA